MVAPILPLLGLALEYGPKLIGMVNDDAGEAAERVAGVVQSVTGTDDAHIAREALSANPELRVELQRQLNELAIALAQEETKRQKAVNETIRAEAKGEDPWTRRWRPFIGFITGVSFFAAVIGFFVIVGMAIAKNDPTFMGHIPTLIGQLVMLFGVPGAILGVASWHRGVKQRLEVDKP